MGNVNMEADQIHVRDNSHKTWRTVADALKALEASGEGVAEDITELYTRDASRASKDDIAGEFSAEQAYYAGDYVYYEGSLFKFTANHSGDWDPADVVVAQIGDDLVELKSGLTTLDTEVNGDATVYPYADVITIEDAVPANLADCMVKIEPVQEGSGDPSPTNVRPITGHTEASVTVADDAENPTVTKTYTIALGDTIYGGTVRIDSNGNTVMDVDDVKRVFDGSEDETWTTRTSQSGYTLFEIVLSDTRSSSAQTQVGLCNEFPWNIGFETDRSYRYYQTTIGIRYDGLTLAEFKEWLSNNELEVTLPIDTPTTIQLTPQQIQLLKGTNTLTASTGQISVTVNGVSGSIGSLTSDKQDKTDYALETTAKTVVGGINELNTLTSAIDARTFANNSPVFFAPNWRGGQNYNDIVLNKLEKLRCGFLLTKAGIFPFQTNTNGDGFIVDSNVNLTITNEGNNTYRFACAGEWYTTCLFMFLWDYR